MKSRIHYEFFGPASVLEEDESPAPLPDSVRLSTPPITAPNDVKATQIVTLQPSGQQLPWTPDSTSLLECLESGGLQPAFNCRAGLCNTCLTPLISGEVIYIEEPLVPPGEGQVLLCCARPLTDITLQLPAH